MAIMKIVGGGSVETWGLVAWGMTGNPAFRSRDCLAIAV